MPDTHDSPDTPENHDSADTPVIRDSADTSEETRRAFVLGLDGVPWRLLREWAANGELEHVAQLIEEGAAGPLSSTTPATTPLAWPSIATGTRPDKHEIYGFRRPRSEYTQEIYTSKDLARPPVWELLSPSVVGNVPMTYPIVEADGVMVSGMMTPATAPPDRFACPPALREEIKARIPDYEVGLTWHRYDGPSEEFLADLAALVENRRELMRLLMEYEEWRLFFFVYTAPDRLQHLTWDEKHLLSHYRVLDEIVGEVMDYVADRDGTLYVVSDHGFGPIDAQVAPNQVLADEGLFVRRDPSGLTGVLDRLGMTKGGLTNVLRSAGVDPETVVEQLPAPLREGVAARVPGEHALYDMDYDETVAFVHELGNVYVNDTERFERGIVDPADIPAVKRELTDAFSDVTDPETGQPVLEVYDGDELFPTDPASPDLVVEGREGYEVTPDLPGAVLSPAGKKVASHRPEGILLAWGRDVASGVTPTEATVYDVMPTLLHGSDEPVPENTDGRVLTEIFAPESKPASREPRTRAYERTRVRTDDEGLGDDGNSGDGKDSSDDDFEDVEDRLRGLGYLN